MHTKDSSGNETTSDGQSFITTTPSGSTTGPVISLVSTAVPKDELTSIIITWTTDEYATTQAQYGTNQNNLTAVTSEDQTLDIDHYVKITDLTPGTTYYFRARSADDYGNASLSDINSFTTKDSPVAPKIEESSIFVSTLSTRATITWKTDKASTSIVEYGTSSAYGTEVGDTDARDTTHIVEISGLESDTTYYYRVKSTDDEANTGHSKGHSFSTKVAPTIYDVGVSNIGLNDALIDWKTTTVTTTVVYYGTELNNLDKQVIDESLSYTTLHTIHIIGLDTGTTYYFKVAGVDDLGNSSESGINDFTTRALPIISNVAIDEVTAHTATVSYLTNVETDSIIAYGQDETYPYTQGISELITEHQVTLINLEDESTYYIQVKARDQYGNEAALGGYSLETPVDEEAPDITNVMSETSVRGSGNEADVQLTITWETNELTTSQVEYDKGLIQTRKGSVSYNFNTIEKKSLDMNHVVIISDLEPLTAYHFRVRSKDASGNESVSNDYTLTTPSARRSILTRIVETLENTFSWVGGVKEYFQDLFAQ